MTRGRIVCFGDSNTYGYDPSGYLGSCYPDFIPWTKQLEQSGYDVVNLGMNGRTIPSGSLIADVATMCKSYEPYSLLVIMLGTNDLLLGQPLSLIAEKMDRFLASLTTRLPSGKILLIGPPAMQAGSWVRDPVVLESSRHFFARYAPVAKKYGVQAADAKEWEVEIAGDGIHLTPSGHAAFARGLLALLRKTGI